MNPEGVVGKQKKCSIIYSHIITMISIIIPYKNRLNDINMLLDSIQHQDYSDYEIILVNDSLKTLNLEYDNLTIIDNKISLGPAESKNIGAKNAAGNYLLFLDSDVIFENNNILSNYIEIYNKLNQLGSIGGQYYYKDNKKYYIMSNILFNGETYSKEISANDINSNYQKVDFNPSNNLFIIKDLFFNVGGFYPDYKIYFEDKELCRRISKLGYDNYFSYKAAVYHKFKTDSRITDLKIKHRNRIIYFRRNRKKLLYILPIIDLLMLPILCFIRTHAYIKNNINILKHIQENKKKKSILNFIYISFKYIMTLLKSYKFIFKYEK